MSKNQNQKNQLHFISFLLLILAIGIICMGFLPGVTYTPERGDPSSVTGFKLAFGGTIEGLSGNIGNLFSQETTIPFSILAALCLALPFVGALFMALFRGRFGAFIGFLCFLFAGITFFFFPQITFIKSVTSSIIGSEGLVAKTSFFELGYELGTGSIIGAILSIIGSAGAASKLIFAK